MKTEFHIIATMISHGALMDIADRVSKRTGKETYEAGCARRELMARVRRGDVQDMDFLRARDILNLA